MVLSSGFERALRNVGRLGGLVLLIVLLTTVFPGVARCGDNLLPSQLDDLKFGLASAQVTEKMQDYGTPERSALKRPKRFKLTWPLKNNPYFDQADFEFTEKDRLYLVRFMLKDSYRFKTKELKKRMFPRFGISWEFPGKLRTKEKDIMLYIPLPDRKSPFFFEMTDTMNGRKWFELFDKNMSAQDRLSTKAEAAKKKAEDETQNDESKKVSPQESSQPKETKSAKEEGSGSEAK